MIVAIDGPAGSGKSTTARAVADRLDYLYIDTGAMYRAVALAAERRGGDLEHSVLEVLPTVRVDLEHDESGFRVFLNGEDVSDAIRRPQIGVAASRVSAVPAVREKLVAEQRRIAREFTKQGRGVVLDGRDIGTVVFPDAELKVFMVADAEVRARRRVDELRARGFEAVREVVLAEMNERDRQDRERAIAPLKKADDAIELDTSAYAIDEQVALVVRWIQERNKITSV